MLPVLMRPRGSRKEMLSPLSTRYARIASARELALDLEKVEPGTAPGASDSPPLAADDVPLTAGDAKLPL